MKKLLFILFIFISSYSIAQNNYEFSGRVDKYTYELNEFLSFKASKDKRKKIESITLSFNNFWGSDTLTTENKKSIIEISNMMIKKRFHASPTFFLFIDNILSIKRDEDNSDNFEDWINSITYYIKRKRTGYLHTYFKYSIQFFKTHRIYVKAKKHWKLSNGKMSIENDNHNPVFVFNNVDLIGTTGKDSSYIVGTSGKYYPLKQRWLGYGGKIFWTRVNLDTAVVFAKLKKYKIDLKTSIWRADSVDFYDRRTFDYVLEGKIRDKFGYSTPNKNSLYPSFDSYRHDYIINEIYPDIDFFGGYNLQGLKLIGKGEGDVNAYFIFKHNGTKFVWAGSKNFVIDKSKIISEKVSVTIYLASVDSVTGELELDSIYHPGLSLYYSNVKRKLSIYRKKEGISRTPFLDSYHNVDMYVEELNWKLGDNYIDMKAIQQQGIESKAYFESVNLFSKNRYDRLQGLDRINPVRAVYNYTEKIGFDEFYADEFSSYMKLGRESTIAFLLNLASKGFLIYDIESNYVIVKENVRTYILAEKGEIDYDVISFNSTTDGRIPNASLNLLNNEIILQGVSTVFLSDSQDVKIIPKNGRVVLKENRDFTFTGKIMAGRFDLYAQDCYFSYDKFEIDLPDIDSLSFKVESFVANDYGENPLVRVKAVIEDLKGNILIDHPNNKSGRESFPDYPILNSKTNSYVYYDKSSIYNKVYDREHFFYRLNSFTIDSLDDFKTDGLQFEGYLSSAGIFPDIEVPLMVQHDYSLGFNTTTGDNGLELYGGLGMFNDSLSLTNNGLAGNGKLEFLTSISYSNKFVFFPDSTNGFVNDFEIKEQVTGVEYPPVIGSSLDEHWEPYNDVMNVTTTSIDEPLKMYGTEAKMDGLIALSSKDMKGDGLINIKNAEMRAENFVYLNRSYSADSCEFGLRTFVDVSVKEAAELEADDKYAYKTDGKFKANVDFDQRKGVFESTTGSHQVTFSENQYICFMDKFTWYMDEDISEFGSSTKADPFAEEEDEFAEFDETTSDVGMSGTQFISIHPKQDSLNFFAASALYMQREKLIHAFEVPVLEVADALIIPSSHEVIIHAKAKMDELTDCELSVNRITKYHSLYNGTFKVDGRHNYHGRALYDYKDEDKNIQNIFFDKISVDTAGFTIGTAKVDKSANFSLSKNFDFEGGVTLVGGLKFLRFNGGTRLNYECDTFEREQVRFVSEIDPMKIRIPIGEEVKNYRGYRLFSGIKARESNGYVYSSFLSSVGSRSDHVVLQSMGYLMFDNISQEYRIASEDKLDQHELPGNYLSLSKRSCSVLAEGKLDLVYNTGHVEAETYGTATYFKRKDSSVFNVSLPLDFYFNDKAIELMASDINSRSDMSAVDLENNTYVTMLGNKLGAKKADELISKIVTNGGEYRKIPKELIKTIFISDVRFKYNKRSRSLVSVGPIGIASIGKEQILKYVEGNIEIQNKGSVFKLTIALEVGSGYYYFQFKGNQKAGQVLAYSSNNEFNTIIKETKADDRKYKIKGKQSKFNYYITTPTAYKKFKRMLKMKK